MKILLIGPFPPPHGGISVHVSGIRAQLLESANECHVLDTSRVRPGLRFGTELLRHAWQGWTLHLHTNGHNWKSWVLALWCALTGRLSGGSILTLHSGMAPEYLQNAPASERRLAAFTCGLCQRVICANGAIRDAVIRLGTESARAEVLPAFVGVQTVQAVPDLALMAWMAAHQPLFSTVLFFRPEYGFDVLLAGLAKLRSRYPSLGCLVMGSGEQRAEAEALLRSAGLVDNVLLVGDVHHDRCLAIMSACDVFLRPTREDGDSISVREALSLGVSVVASDAGTRPAGAHLFPPGDVDAMVIKIILALENGRGAQPRFDGCMDRLMEIYHEVDRSEGRLCLN
jgi:glycogen(starch) synthase